jgi:hypothetical protein
LGPGLMVAYYIRIHCYFPSGRNNISLSRCGEGEWPPPVNTASTTTSAATVEPMHLCRHWLMDYISYAIQINNPRNDKGELWMNMELNHCKIESNWGDVTIHNTREARNEHNNQQDIVDGHKVVEYLQSIYILCHQPIRWFSCDGKIVWSSTTSSSAHQDAGFVFCKSIVSQLTKLDVVATIWRTTSRTRCYCCCLCICDAL